MAKLISVNVGLPRDISWEGRTVHTGIWKNPVQGRRVVRRLNIDGDGQGDLAGHGGEQRAVFVYQTDSYSYWERQLGRNDFAYGQFGENFTIDGLADDEVCIGDRFQVGSALFEVSTQPRVTCYRVGIRMNDPRMPSLLVAHHRPGFYFRVLQDGEVQSGDEIIKVADGPARMTVASVDALLYLNTGSPEQLETALTIPALSPGWQQSFRAMLEEQQKGSATGNAGLIGATEPPPAWPGFRPLRTVQMHRESGSVLSLVLEPADGKPLSPALPGQYVVLRMRVKPDAPPVLRNYSLSDLPSADHYRVSVKLEEHGVASGYLHHDLRPGDVLDVSSPRGTFTLGPGNGPVVLRAGVGATPVLAMLHALVAESSKREVWWLYGARNREDHPFFEESRQLMKSLQRGRTYICYSRPGPQDHLGSGFDAIGRIDIAAIEQLGISRGSDFYLCGPAAFLHDFKAGLLAWGITASQVYEETFGAEGSITPGVVGAVKAKPHQPSGAPGSGPRVSFARSGVDVNWDPKYRSVLELAEACDVPVRWSCRTGVCHTCETAMISGSVSYNPDPLQPPAEGNVLICCCRPKEELAVDL